MYRDGHDNLPFSEGRRTIWKHLSRTMTGVSPFLPPRTLAQR